MKSEAEIKARITTFETVNELLTARGDTKIEYEATLKTLRWILE